MPRRRGAISPMACFKRFSRASRKRWVEFGRQGKHWAAARKVSTQHRDDPLPRLPFVRSQMLRVRPVALEIRVSRIDGKGLFATARINARKKLGELTGEVISEAEA